MEKVEQYFSWKHRITEAESQIIAVLPRARKRFLSWLEALMPVHNA